MRKLIIIIALALLSAPAEASEQKRFSVFKFLSSEKSIEKVLNSQARYANNSNYKKFMSTFSPEYTNADGFSLEDYSKLIKDIWNTYKDIEYSIQIEDIKVDGNKAIAKVIETTFADTALLNSYNGKLISKANTLYHLEKNSKGKWKVSYDSVVAETTQLLYGDAQNIEYKLTVPEQINANTEYIASLEFTPPNDTIAIASLAVDKIEYPQGKTEEVFRAMPEDNILERFFTSNNENKNEYVIASIGLTKTSICDLNIKLSLTGFGYVIKRINVLDKDKEINIDDKN